jgi:hypothetical protein
MAALKVILGLVGALAIVQGQTTQFVRLDTARASFCSGNQYFDTTELTCKICPENTVPIANSKLILLEY